MLPENGHRSQCLRRWYVTRASHDYVRFATLIVAGPGPDANALSAMLHGGIHAQPLRGRMFSSDDDIHVMPATQTMVHDRQQTIGIRRQVHPDNLGLFIDHVVDEPRVLVGETVVILPPNVRSE